MKYFLLTAGYNYYPGRADDDWHGTFETREEAEATITKDPTVQINGRQCYDILIGNAKYDWFKVIDLRKWIGAQND